MTTTTASALTELPHSGLRVPDTLMGVVAYRPHRTRKGLIAYTATLRYDGKIVGTIENDGLGGETWLRLRDRTVFGDGHVDAYVAQCRNARGEQVTTEDLLCGLVTEHEFAGIVRDVQAQGQILARRMEYPLAGADPVGDAITFELLPLPKPPARAARRVLVAALEMRPISEHGWWELWTGERWERITEPAVPVTTA